tara:strand:+ start:2497 stop:2634 length:138 start_codon:yes stop_codon:yes gene_type:complete
MIRPLSDGKKNKYKSVEETLIRLVETQAFLECIPGFPIVFPLVVW